MIDDDEAGDRREALERIVGQPLVERRIDRERHLRADHQGVAVRRRLGDVFRGELVVGAGAMLDHDLAAPGFREPLRQDAAEPVDDAAGRRRRNQRHRPRRIVLRRASHRGDEPAAHMHPATINARSHDVIVASLCALRLLRGLYRRTAMRLLRRPACSVRMSRQGPKAAGEETMTQDQDGDSGCRAAPFWRAASPRSHSSAPPPPSRRPPSRAARRSGAARCWWCRGRVRPDRRARLVELSRPAQDPSDRRDRGRLLLRHAHPRADVHPRRQGGDRDRRRHRQGQCRHQRPPARRNHRRAGRHHRREVGRDLERPRDAAARQDQPRQCAGARARRRDRA